VKKKRKGLCSTFICFFLPTLLHIFNVMSSPTDQPLAKRFKAEDSSDKSAETPHSFCYPTHPRLESETFADESARLYAHMNLKYVLQNEQLLESSRRVLKHIGEDTFEEFAHFVATSPPEATQCLRRNNWGDLGLRQVDIHQALFVTRKDYTDVPLFHNFLAKFNIYRTQPLLKEAMASPEKLSSADKLGWIERDPKHFKYIEIVVTKMRGSEFPDKKSHAVVYPIQSIAHSKSVALLKEWIKLKLPIIDKIIKIAIPSVITHAGKHWNCKAVDFAEAAGWKKEFLAIMETVDYPIITK
jgi:hypothetical protein